MGVFEGAFTPEAWSLTLDVLLKCGIGVLLAGAIGWEREMQGRPAGIRTHMLMVLGVVLFSEVSKAFDGDPSRVAAQVVTGVGFLGAGTIMRMGPEVKGLTTAASLWASAGIGMCVSMGGAWLWIATLATILGLVTLTAVDSLGKRFITNAQTVSMVLRLEDRQSIGLLSQALKDAGVEVRNIVFAPEGDDLDVVVKCRGDRAAAMETAAKTPGVERAAWMD